MNSAQKLTLIALIALSVTGCWDGRSAAPTQGQQPRWTLVADSAGGVWRMDLQTGAMDRCSLGGDAQVHCLAARVPASKSDDPLGIR